MGVQVKGGKMTRGGADGLGGQVGDDVVAVDLT